MEVVCIERPDGGYSFFNARGELVVELRFAEGATKEEKIADTEVLMKVMGMWVGMNERTDNAPID